MLDLSCKYIKDEKKYIIRRRDMEKREIKKILEKNFEVLTNLWRSL